MQECIIFVYNTLIIFNRPFKNQFSVHGKLERKRREFLYCLLANVYRLLMSTAPTPRVFFVYSFKFKCFACMYVFVHHIYAWCSGRPEEHVTSPEMDSQTTVSCHVDAKCSQLLSYLSNPPPITADERTLSNSHHASPQPVLLMWITQLLTNVYRYVSTVIIPYRVFPLV